MGDITKQHTRSSSAPAFVWRHHRTQSTIEKRFSAIPLSRGQAPSINEQQHQQIIVRVGSTQPRRASHINHHPTRRIAPSWDILPTKIELPTLDLKQPLSPPPPTTITLGDSSTRTTTVMSLQHKLSTSRKRLIVILVSVAAFFAPFSANSYFPAMGNIEKELSVSSQQVNLSVTVFMIFQAISPSFWSSLADSHGRRPIYLYTLFIYILACIGVALCQNYWWLLTFRMLQAFGSSSVIAIGAGTISDITTPAERGGYIGWFSLGWNLGPLVGPALGGFLSEYLGWRWIFWISAVVCGIHWVILGFILPETLRTLVGTDGSGYANPTPSQWWQHRKQQRERNQPDEKADDDDCHSCSTTATVVAFDSNEKTHGNDTKHRKESEKKTHTNKLSFCNILCLPFQPLIYAKEKDILALLILYSAQYAACYAVTTSLPYLFTRMYALTESQVGASYLANGFGCIMGAMAQGRMLNRNYQKMLQQVDLPCMESQEQDHLMDDLPIEHARLRMSWFHALVSNLVIACYGWCLYLKAHLALILGLHFVLGFTSQVIFNAVQTLLVDLFPERSATVTATNNVFRCLFGALSTVLVLPAIQCIGVGWTFVIISVIVMFSRVALYLELTRGATWRRQRIERTA